MYAEEQVGANFDLEQMLVVRGMTRRAIHDIAAKISPGMKEEDAVALARDVLRQAGLGRGWHGVFVRFGPNTLKTFGAPSEPGTVLQPNDIFFIDIGPIWQKWEGDGGDTFVVGNDAEMHRCAEDARVLFKTVKALWAKENLSGQALYDFATAEAKRMGWELNLDLSGHRLADFPHAAYFKGALADIPFHPSPERWILEIHIRHPSRPIGAFYEDMLLNEEAPLAPL